MPKFLGKTQLIGMGSLAAAGLLVSAWQAAHGEVATKHQPVASEPALVRAQKIELREVGEARAAIGEIRPKLESDLSFRVSGKIIKRMAEIGMTVKKGDVLALIDDEDYRNKVRNAATDVAAAEAALVEAQSNERRLGRLFEAGATSSANYETAVKSLRSAEAKLKSAQISLQMAEDQLSDTELRAEFDGVVTAVSAEAGQFVNAGQAVLRLADPGAYDAVFSVPEAAFARETPTDQPPRVLVSLLSNPSVKAVGTVREISPVADAATRTFQVKVSLDEPPPAMRFGSSVAGHLARKSNPLVTLPGGAVFDKDGTPAVWVVDLESEVSLKPVKIDRYEIDKAIISEGLSTGDIVVTAGVNRLHDKQKVRLQEGVRK